MLWVRETSWTCPSCGLPISGDGSSILPVLGEKPPSSASSCTLSVMSTCSTFSHYSESGHSSPRTHDCCGSSLGTSLAHPTMTFNRSPLPDLVPSCLPSTNSLADFKYKSASDSCESLHGIWSYSQSPFLRVAKGWRRSGSSLQPYRLFLWLWSCGPPLRSSNRSGRPLLGDSHWLFPASWRPCNCQGEECVHSMFHMCPSFEHIIQFTIFKTIYNVTVFKFVITQWDRY